MYARARFSMSEPGEALRTLTDNDDDDNDRTAAAAWVSTAAVAAAAAAVGGRCGVAMMLCLHVLYVSCMDGVVVTTLCHTLRLFVMRSRSFGFYGAAVRFDMFVC